MKSMKKIVLLLLAIVLTGLYTSPSSLADRITNLAGSGGGSGGPFLPLNGATTPNEGAVVITGGSYTPGPPFNVSCVGDCQTLVGAQAGALLPSVDFLTTAVGFNACGSMTDLRTESTCIGWNAAGNITGITAGNGHFLTVMGVNVLGACTTNCNSDTLIGVDTARESMTLTNSVCIGGGSCLFANSTNIVALGLNAHRWNASATGDNNIAIGAFSMFAVNATTATNLIGIGSNSLTAVTTAANGVAIGFDVAQNATTDTSFAYIGWKAAQSAVGSSLSTCLGNQCLGNGIFSGNSVNAIGSQAGFNLAAGIKNNLFGNRVGLNMTSAQQNTFIGDGVGQVCTTCFGSLLIGSGRVAIETPAASTNSYINIENIFTTTGTNAPSTSASVIAGNLQVVGSVRNATRTVTAAGTDTATAQDVTIVFNKTVAAASAETIPTCAAGTSGRRIIVKDGKGDAATNNIVISPVSGLIDGAASVTISRNSGSVQLSCDGSSAWNVVASNLTPVVNPVLAGTTGSIGGGALLAGACTSGTVTVTGATTAMVATSSPVTYPGDGSDWDSYVSAVDTVTVKVCALVAVTPTASAYNVRVLQ